MPEWIKRQLHEQATVATIIQVRISYDNLLLLLAIFVDEQVKHGNKKEEHVYVLHALPFLLVPQRRLLS
jgi:hypothetical protein